MKKITLLAASALLFFTACSQVENSPAEVVPPPTNVVREEVQQPQVTSEPATTVQEQDTVSVAVQEQPQEEKAPQTETSLDKGTQRKTTENELPSLTQCTA